MVTLLLFTLSIIFTLIYLLLNRGDLDRGSRSALVRSLHDEVPPEMGRVHRHCPGVVLHELHPDCPEDVAGDLRVGEESADVCEGLRVDTACERETRNETQRVCLRTYPFREQLLHPGLARDGGAARLLLSGRASHTAWSAAPILMGGCVHRPSERWHLVGCDHACRHSGPLCCSPRRWACGAVQCLGLQVLGPSLSCVHVRNDRGIRLRAGCGKHDMVSWRCLS